MATATKTPLDQFRVAVSKVIAMNRTSTMFTSLGAGAEPGVDPRHYNAELRYRGIRQPCEIRIMDYSSVSMKSGSMSNIQLVNMLNDPQVSERPSWAKVRWIDVGGISWDVLKALAIKYKIHPLALENILHTHTKPTASKSDYYHEHLFLRILCLELRDENSVIRLSETQWEWDATMDIEDLQPDSQDRPFNREAGSFSDTTPGLDAAATVQVEALMQRGRVEVNVFPIFILLFKNGLLSLFVSRFNFHSERPVGTVITLHRTTNAKLMEPIRDRLSRPDTLLRSTCDASVLVQSLLDLAVDKAMGITEACEYKLKKYEKQLLLKPEVNTVSNLHILTGDINLHQRALVPLKRVIYGLRRYDLDRCIALLNLPPGEEVDVKMEGYMSRTALTYLADVYDHIDYILRSLDVVENLGENLIGYSFNLTSHEMNVIMKRLTLITVICLPLTFLTGYGGMNFKGPPMWWTMAPTHSDIWFWIVALPVMAVVVPFFLFSELKNLYHVDKNRELSQKALRSYQSQRQGSGSKNSGFST
ncbi:magnesium -like protein [Lentinula edodes]|uniref:Magnesium-like protein n=1 Tax=Lentinula edodes TaxID=5353 RepID=A0A1Q3E8E9_LENED|nr:magnesium -like protein [Lentinula edodes]